MCPRQRKTILEEELNTSLGAIREESVMVFSGGISALVLPIITKQSPEGTALTLPLNHPVDAPVDAICHYRCLSHEKN